VLTPSVCDPNAVLKLEVLFFNASKPTAVLSVPATTVVSALYPTPVLFTPVAESTAPVPNAVVNGVAAFAKPINAVTCCVVSGYATPVVFNIVAIIISSVSVRGESPSDNLSVL
jgi:hypothetical protein